MSENNGKEETAIMPYRIVDGKPVFTDKEAFVKEFKKWTEEEFLKKLLTVGLGGSRNSLRAKYEILAEYLSSDGRVALPILIVRKGYSVDSVERVMLELKIILQEFEESLVNKNLKTAAQKKEFTVEDLGLV